MGRINRMFLGCGLGLLLAASGCRSPRSDVPPGPPIAKETLPPAQVGFGSDPHPNNLPPINPAVTGMNQGRGMGANPYNTPGAGVPPGTFGVGAPPSQMTMPSRPNMAPAPAPAAGPSAPASMNNLPDEDGMPAINP